MDKIYEETVKTKKIIREKINKLFDTVGLFVIDLSGKNCVPFIQSYLFSNGMKANIVQEMLSDGRINTGRMLVLYRLVQFTEKKTKVNVKFDVLMISLIKTLSIW